MKNIFVRQMHMIVAGIVIMACFGTVVSGMDEKATDPVFVARFQSCRVHFIKK